MSWELVVVVLLAIVGALFALGMSMSHVAEERARERAHEVVLGGMELDAWLKAVNLPPKPVFSRAPPAMPDLLGRRGFTSTLRPKRKDPKLGDLVIYPEGEHEGVHPGPMPPEPTPEEKP